MKCISYHFLSVISNETRWKIIYSLYTKDKYVSEIVKDTNEEQSKISHSLKVLSDCNIVFSKKEGNFRKYSLNKETIKPLVKLLEKHAKSFCGGECKYK